MQGYWKLEENGNDSSGNSRTLTTLTNVQWDDGPSGRCYFSPDNSVARGAYGAAINGSAWTAVTLALWARAIADAPNWSRLVCYGTYDVNGVDLYLTPATRRIGFQAYRAAAHDSVDSGADLSDELWHSVVATFLYSTKQYSIYVDGVLVKQNTFPNTPVKPNAPVYIGNSSVMAAAGVFVGQIDEVVLDNTVWTPEQVAAYAHKEPPRIILGQAGETAMAARNLRVGSVDILPTNEAAGSTVKLCNADGTVVLLPQTRLAAGSPPQHLVFDPEYVPSVQGLSAPVCSNARLVVIVE